MAMTIEAVRDRLASWHGGSEACLDVKACAELGDMIAALDAHLTQPAQAVDVVAIREVIARLERASESPCRLDVSFLSDEAEQLTRALSGEKAGRVGDGWQPIETAPKDGSVILVNDTTGEAPWASAKWLEGEQWSGWIYDDELALDNNPVGPLPTFWFALPPLPASPTPGKEGA